MGEGRFIRLPVGFINELHEPPTFLGALRPGLERSAGSPRVEPAHRGGQTRFARCRPPAANAPADGADTLFCLVVDEGAPLVETGRFWLDPRPRPLHRLASTRRSDTPEERERLWSWPPDLLVEGLRSMYLGTITARRS